MQWFPVILFVVGFALISFGALTLISAYKEISAYKDDKQQRLPTDNGI